MPRITCWVCRQSQRCGLSASKDRPQRLPPPLKACYKNNMRRWMRDRSKRRKQQSEKQGQDQPAPLQPKFPDPIPDDIGNRIEGYEPPASDESTDREEQPAVQAGGGDDQPPQGFRRD